MKLLFRALLLASILASALLCGCASRPEKDKFDAAHCGMTASETVSEIGLPYSSRTLSPLTHSEVWFYHSEQGDVRLIVQWGKLAEISREKQGRWQVVETTHPIIYASDDSSVYSGSGGR